jgi:broad specificity phosphatase PhoE
MTSLLRRPVLGDQPEIDAALDHPVWLVRHAPTSWTGRRWCGRADPPLNRSGRAAAVDLARRLAGELPPDTVVWTSPARRARATALAIATEVGLATAVDPDLVEVDVGLAEGLTWDEMTERLPDVAAAILRGEPVNWPGGESRAAVRERAQEVVTRLAAAAVGQPVVVVSHGAFLHAVVAALVERAAGPDAPPTLVALPVFEAGGVLRIAPGQTQADHR